MINNSDKLAKFSASSTKTYETCPRKYYYTYIDKLPKKSWPHLMMGTFSHNVLEEFHKTWNLNKNLNLVDLMKNCFINAREKIALNNDNLAECKDFLQSYLNLVLTEGMPNVIGIELPFEINIDDKYIIRGFIDRLDIDKDGIFNIVDYKTSKNEKYLDTYQLLIYGMAILNKFPNLTSFRGTYILLRHDCRKLKYNFNLNDIEKCKKKFTDYVELISNDKYWHKQPSPLCKWCDFETTCFANEKQSENSDWM